MIYIMGMSHILPVLDACSADGLKAQLGRISNDQAPQFVDWHTDPAQIAVPVQVANLYIRQIAPHWGPTLALQSSPSVISMAPGFQKMLAGMNGEGGQGGNVLFTFIHGEEHIHLALREQPQPLDFWLPERPDLAPLPGRQIVPLYVIELQVAAQIAKAQAILLAIRAMQPSMPVFNVVCPPTIPGERWDPGPGVVDPEAVDMSPLSVRLKYYLVYARQIRESARACGINSLLPPAEAMDPQGYLAAEFAGDSVHGNKRYGALVLRQMAEIAEKTGQRRVPAELLAQAA
ncbi:hypothetical protein LRH25_12005 [Ideonella azotifigens]|uniref:SGNH/GDSL hydrolase family protein n=1 Tax=Ideonella azotifigens TaxID=513160 RepID=A0ABN1JTX4_9BURK|nr:hypothetical protein [Ideonella azotifigens]MCD2341067.1 hypothetical protein [Ideonella azotifigens]